MDQGPHTVPSFFIKPLPSRYSRLCATTDHYNIIHQLYTLRLTSLDYPRQLISEHSFPWITCSAHQQRLKNKQADDITKPTIYYKTLYNKEKPTTW